MQTFIQSAHTNLSKYIDIDYFVRFFLLLICLHYANLLYIAVIDPKGVIYGAFFDSHLNYITWLRNSILYFSNIITNALGTSTYVNFPYQLKTFSGRYVETVYECLGLGLMSFWAAFITAHKETTKRKLLWCCAGIFCIWFINCCRVALLLIAVEKNWKYNSIIDHHTQFNIVAYSLIVLMIYLYNSDGKKRLTASNLNTS